ncbi:MAG: chemotaxis protein CheX [Candidatus Scalindua sp.]|nr:chemotaxis protein CheX [Candidatus Scalindua sp.]
MKHSWDISGVIGVVGDIEGILVLRVTKVFAEKILESSGMTFDNDEEKNILTTGVITEIVNVISGNALPLLNAEVLDITPPVVIQGVSHTISWPSTSPIIGVPFSSDLGNLEIQISI